MEKKRVPYYKVVRCEDCEHFLTDEDGEDYCDINLDEDEEEKLRCQGTNTCPYFKFYNEYKSVQKQI